MGKYSVPEEIRKLKPKGTMVKVINGKYYVYEHSFVKVDDKWKTKMGKLVGSISLDLGFVPNQNYSKNEMLTSMNFGEYFISYKLSYNVLNKLLEVFNPKEAYQIYLLSLLHFVNGFTYVKNIKPDYDLSYLSKRYPSISLSEHIITNLFDNLGKHTTNVEKFEQLLVDKSSKELAVDGHVIKTSSHDNDLAEKGNKNNKLGDYQMNALMAYDINNSEPIFSRIYPGGTMDNISFKDIFKRIDFNNTLFIIDKGFSDPENLRLCSENGNKYIIPLKANYHSYKKITENIKFDNIFSYQKGKKHTPIQYKSEIIDGVTVTAFKDLSQYALESSDYMSKIGDEKGVYTLEKYNEYEKTFGLIVLQSNLDKSPEEIYKLYKKRWTIETFYDYYKNKLEVDATYSSDYYQAQGLSFILLITSLIHSEFVKNTSKIKKSVTDILLDARYVKLHYKKTKWELENLSKKHYELFNSLGLNLNEELEYLNKLK